MPVIILFCSIAILAVVSQLPEIRDFMVWDRQLIIDHSQWWRIVTGNITHTNDNHLGMNLAALAVIYWVHKDYYKALPIAALILTCMLAVGVAMFSSSYNLYAGLSGMLHGLFAWGIVRDIFERVRFSLLLFIGLIVKVIYEVINGGAASTESFINAAVAVEAHVAGTLAGLLFVTPFVFQQLQKKPD
ncbi:rhombosortase [Veronia pacifica]|uniref:Rhombosortase n=1 Tax=Veronia pacifica TaxID=1080227 RepID=A0A1C3ERE1_9GAMM|nr:rhombosortase [Veronia pacifica]ODA35791.1 rhombosortase [Veronia pacifica]